jgi:hypothetical protein
VEIPASAHLDWADAIMSSTKTAYEIGDRGQGTPLSQTAVHSQRGREAAIKGYPGSAALIEGRLSGDTSYSKRVCKSVKKVMVHLTVILLSPVEDEQAFCSPLCILGRTVASRAKRASAVLRPQRKPHW